MSTTQYSPSGIRATSVDGNALIFPLKHTEVRARIAGNLSRTEVKQQFENPLTQPLEAVYYSESLQFEGGNYEFVFPMVVGPRFIPGMPIGDGDTDRVPDASRITPLIIPPQVRSGRDINVSVEINAGVPIREVTSPSHRLDIAFEDGVTRVRLNNSDTIPNKDLILRYRVATDNTQATLLTEIDSRGTHFALYLIPAIEYNAKDIVPKDVVFLMDTSGSQDGYPLAQSKELMRRFINGLNPDDTFTIIDFSDVTVQLSPHPLPNTAKNRQKAIAYINRLQANGGTYLLKGIQAVLNYPRAADGRLRSIVLLTDGYIGNDNEILAEVQQNLQPGNRLYSFGVGSSVNRFLLDRIAEVGRGTSQIVRYDEDPEPVAEKFFRQINNPVLTNIQLQWSGNGENTKIYPSTPPDLFAQQPLVAFGRFASATGTLQVSGVTAGGQHYEREFNLAETTSQDNRAIAQLWGRMRIKDLMGKMYRYETKACVDAVTKTALSYQLLSQYTAFVAVSEEIRVDREGESVTVSVPVEIPDGVSYESAVLCSAPAPLAMAGTVFERACSAPIEEKCRGVSSSKRLFPKALGAVKKAFSTFGPISIARVTGLDDAAVVSLEQHLQELELPSGLSGEIAFEFQVQNGRVRDIFLDEDASTVKNVKAILLLKRSLLRWQVPTNCQGKVNLHLQIQLELI
jgi:Ca-activated chloride channel homolog